MRKNMLAVDSTPTEDDSSVGNLLMRMGVITPEMLSKALLVQGQLEGRVLLGEVLVELGMISEKNLIRALELQDRMRTSNGNGDWMSSLMDAMDDNLNENIRQVDRLKNALKSLEILDD